MADIRCGKRVLKEKDERMSVFTEESTKSSDEGEQQLSHAKEEIPDLWSSSSDHQNPVLFRVKREDWEQLTDSDGELLTKQEEPDCNKFPFTVVAVKIGDDSENLHTSPDQHMKPDDREAESPTSSSADQMGIEPDGEESGGPEAHRDQDLKLRLNVNTDENASASSVTEFSGEEEDDCDNIPPASGSEIEDGDDDWVEPGKRQSGEKSSSRLDEANLCKTEQAAGPQKVLNGQTLFVCDVCGKPFYYVYHLKRHMAYHKGEKPFQCDECGKKFTLRGNLNQHMTIHNGEKPFACNFCKKRFRLSSLLQSHVVTHLGVKPFTCEHCGERFTREGAMKRHVVRHTGVKPFACTICDKRFYRKPDLKCHMPVHSRDQKASAAPRNFACDECGKRFIHKCHVARHMITHTGAKTFTCDVCGVMFKWQSALKRHEKKFHSA